MSTASPTGNAVRLRNYLNQNGGHFLTVKQLKRLREHDGAFSFNGVIVEHNKATKRTIIGGTIKLESDSVKPVTELDTTEAQRIAVSPGIHDYIIDTDHTSTHVSAARSRVRRAASKAGNEYSCQTVSDGTIFRVIITA